jgi:hypothetical protein
LQAVTNILEQRDASVFSYKNKMEADDSSETVAVPMLTYEVKTQQ